MQFLTGSVWLDLWTFWQRQDFLLTLLSQKSIITSADQLLQLFFLSTYLYPPRSPPTLIARLPVTVKKSFNMPAFINHSNMFPLGAWNALSVYMPAFPTFLCILTLIVHSVFYSLALWLYVFAPTSNDSCGLRGEGCELLLNKGNAAKMGMIWNTINVILYVPQAEQIIVFYPFWMCMILCVRECVCVCVNLYACENFFLLSISVCMCVCFCVIYLSRNTANRESALGEKF